MSSRNPQINIRVPEHVKSGLHKAAELSGRSVNAEIVFRLERSFGSMPIDKLVPANEARERAESIAINNMEATLVEEITQRINEAIEKGDNYAGFAPDDFEPEGRNKNLSDAFVNTVNRVTDSLEKLGYEVSLVEPKGAFQKRRIIIRF